MSEFGPIDMIADIDRVALLAAGVVCESVDPVGSV